MKIRRFSQVIMGILLLQMLAGGALAHPGHEHEPAGSANGMRIWTEAGGVFELQASFVSARDGKVQLRKASGRLVTLPIDKLSHDDQHWIEERQAEIRSVNQAEQSKPELALAPGDQPPTTDSKGTASRTAEPEMAQAFHAFARLKAIQYRWDDRYFYVESNGMPDHRMMVGITAWQQQVPLPQKYFGANAWQIPLRPVPAKEPATTKNRFLRGAIALAANGIPIFNPLNNRGDDAYLFGELDEFGGHCGRGDDYHYHIAPVHLAKQLGRGLPIAYALDGYPIYGYDEADGSKVAGLDPLNGHKDPAGHYHYHATKTYPYLNGGFYGEVTERDGQVDPQPHAQPLREGLPPLRGAKVVGFTSTKPNQYVLTYEIAGRKGTVEYAIQADGSVDFQFIDPSGRSTSETYQPRRRPPGGPGGNNRRPPRDSVPPEGENRRPRNDGIQAAVKVSRADIPQLSVTSLAFASDGKLPAEFTCDGQGISPPVEWSGAPQGTKYFALSLWHTAPDREKSYWVVYNIPAGSTRLEKNSKTVGRSGVNDMGRNAYEPMCSKGPGIKRYHITVFALSSEVKLSADQATRTNLLAAIRDTTLADGTLTFQYERTRQN